MARFTVVGAELRVTVLQKIASSTRFTIERQRFCHLKIAAVALLMLQLGEAHSGITGNYFSVKNRDFGLTVSSDETL